MFAISKLHYIYVSEIQICKGLDILKVLQKILFSPKHWFVEEKTNKHEMWVVSVRVKILLCYTLQIINQSNIFHYFCGNELR